MEERRAGEGRGGEGKGPLTTTFLWRAKRKVMIDGLTLIRNPLFFFFSFYPFADLDLAERGKQKGIAKSTTKCVRTLGCECPL